MGAGIHSKPKSNNLVMNLSSQYHIPSHGGATSSNNKLIHHYLTSHTSTGNLNALPTHVPNRQDHQPVPSSRHSPHQQNLASNRVFYKQCHPTYLQLLPFTTDTGQASSCSTNKQRHGWGAWEAWVILHSEHLRHSVGCSSEVANLGTCLGHVLYSRGPVQGVGGFYNAK